MKKAQPVLIYLHGFLSSPQSVKATQVRQYLASQYPHIRLEVPQLANFPAAALAQARELVKRYQDTYLGFIGSSMGGFLVTHLVNEFGGKGVLVNPAVDPHLLLCDWLGEHQNPYTKEKFVLGPPHVEELQALSLGRPTEPDRFWVLLQEGDETLDYRLAAKRYAGGRLTVEPGGNHAFTGFDRYLPELVTFLFGPQKQATNRAGGEIIAGHHMS
ncbi:YqiA/YcfP family alpha/beta fold hydrolase [Bowmanella dokdonensis]|uniref:Esterase YqiA n=1 Tax=Bowmanella dokdonensis TaxID=751969 RepID=A0A939DR01_9ALTE|nr:YqiA/YcfP family alpha/beta fold hydrolase [Bowmanella dokdonensis]MBN7826630.1 esterase YqiA [Bowmanella dokdonensis]